jgi:hypothetical protein
METRNVRIPNLRRRTGRVSRRGNLECILVVQHHRHTLEYESCVVLWTIVRNGCYNDSRRT